MYTPISRSLVSLDSRRGTRTSCWPIASTHLASVNKLLLILADSNIRSFWFSVLRLSSDPARSMADAVLILIRSPVVTASFIPRIACDREETAFSYGRFNTKNASLAEGAPHLCGTRRAI